MLRITESKAIALGCWALSVARFVFNGAEVAMLWQSGRWAAVEGAQFKWQMTTTLIVGAASDLLIAGFICAGLLRMRTGFKRTDKLLDKLITFTIGMYISLVRLPQG